MAYEPGEGVRRIQRILETLEQQKTELEKTQAEINRLSIISDRSRQALNNTRRQLAVELAKMDPDGFGRELKDDRARGPLDLFTEAQAVIRPSAGPEPARSI